MPTLHINVGISGVRDSSVFHARLHRPSRACVANFSFASNKYVQFRCSRVSVLFYNSLLKVFCIIY